MLQEVEPQELQKDALQQVAARIIQRAWRRYVNREVFKYFKKLINFCTQRDPQTILTTVNPREGELLDSAAGVFIKFRLGGNTFPPKIYYKIFTYRPISDICASSPEDYAQQSRGKSGSPQDRSGWYQRIENNSWRLFCSKVPCTSKPDEICTEKKMDFHYSKLRRKQDVIKWRKRRKIERMKKMYLQGHMQADAEHQHMTTLVENLPQEEMDNIDMIEDDEIPQSELDELRAWAEALDFESYINEWNSLACSQSSEMSKGVPSFSFELDDEKK